MTRISDELREFADAEVLSAMWLLAIIACPFVVLAMPSEGEDE